MIVAAVQSTTRQDGGYQRVLATDWWRCCHRSLNPCWRAQRRAATGDSHADCSDHYERSGDHTLGYEDAWAAIGNGEADVHRAMMTRPNA